MAVDPGPALLLIVTTVARMLGIRHAVRSKWSQMTQFTGESYLQSMMGHGLRATSNSELVDRLVQRGFLVPPRPEFVDQMKTVERAKFIPDSPSPYSNIPHEIGNKHYMSTPQLHAQVLSLLGPRLGPGRVAAELGCGTGYLPAVMAATGCAKVFAIESDPELLALSEANLGEYPAVITGSTLPDDVVLDALNLSPYMESYAVLLDDLAKYRFSADAIVVASVSDIPMDSPFADQQLMLLERNGEDWLRTDLLRVLCEPSS